MLESEEIKILIPDIQYKEGIIEYLEINKNVDEIFINENIPGEISIDELINKIKKLNSKIKIVFVNDEKVKKNKKEKNSKSKNFNSKVEKINSKNLKLNQKNSKNKKNEKLSPAEIERIREKEIVEEYKKITELKFKNKKSNNKKIYENKKVKTKNEKNMIDDENNFYNEIENRKFYDENEKFDIQNFDKTDNDLQNNNIFYSKKFIPINNKIKNQNGKIISILGANGIGKSIFSLIIAKEINNKKIAIIDFDVLNNSLHILLGIENYSKKLSEKSKIINQNQYRKQDYKIYEKVSSEKIKKIKLDDFVIKTKYNIDLISGLNLIFETDKKIKPEKIRNIFKELKSKYDIVIVDTSSECFFDYTKEILKLSNEAIFISGANLLEIKKSKSLLEIYNKEWKIEKSKIRIIFNKCTKNSIEQKNLNKIFNGYKILGKVKLSDFYDYVINDKKANLDEIEQEVKVISNMITKENKNIKNFNKTINV